MRKGQSSEKGKRANRWSFENSGYGASGVLWYCLVHVGVPLMGHCRNGMYLASS